MRGRSDAVMLRTSRTRLIISVMTLIAVPLKNPNNESAKPMPFRLSICRRLLNSQKSSRYEGLRARHGTIHSTRETFLVAARLHSSAIGYQNLNVFCIIYNHEILASLH